MQPKPRKKSKNKEDEKSNRTYNSQQRNRVRKKKTAADLSIGGCLGKTVSGILAVKIEQDRGRGIDRSV